MQNADAEAVAAEPAVYLNLFVNHVPSSGVAERWPAVLLQLDGDEHLTSYVVTQDEREVQPLVAVQIRQGTDPRTAWQVLTKLASFVRRYPEMVNLAADAEGWIDPAGVRVVIRD